MDWNVAESFRQNTRVAEETEGKSARHKLACKSAHQTKAGDYAVYNCTIDFYSGAPVVVFEGQWKKGYRAPSLAGPKERYSLHCDKSDKTCSSSHHLYDSGNDFLDRKEHSFDAVCNGGKYSISIFENLKSKIGF